MIRRDKSSRGSYSLFISNVDEVLKDLKKIDPAARKAFNVETKKVLTPYLVMAKGFIPSESPLENWRTVAPTYLSSDWGWDRDTKNRGRAAAIRWTWDAGDARRGIKLTRGYSKGTTSNYDNVLGLKNDSVSGKMYELIGQGKRKSDSRITGRNPNAGLDMRRAMNRKHQNRKRVVWRILDEYGDPISFQLSRILEPIVERFERGR